MKNNIFELIYQEYYSAIFRYCRLRLNGDMEGAKDCTQEVFLILFKKIKKLVNLDSVLPWLYETADREVKTYLRKHPEMLNIDDIPEQPQPMPETTILDMLEEDDRRIIELYYQGGDKLELAHQLGISLDALYKRVHRIRQKLQQYLEHSDN